MSVTLKGDDLHPFVSDLTQLTGTDPQQVLSLAMAIDEALDAANGYGTSVVETSLNSPIKYGEIANLSSAAFALAAIAHNEGDPDFIVSLNEAVHDGWAYSIIFCHGFRSMEVREQKLRLVAIPFWLLPEKEQEKDEDAVKAVREWMQNHKEDAVKAVREWLIQY